MRGRPASLAEVASRVLDGAPWWMELADFLDEFYTAPGASALAEAPSPMREKVPSGLHHDAFLAATAEHLGRRYRLPLHPWVFDPDRSLAEPSFAFRNRAGRIFLLKDSPPAFKARNLFVTGNVLERA